MHCVGLRGHKQLGVWHQGSHRAHGRPVPRPWPAQQQHAIQLRVAASGLDPRHVSQQHWLARLASRLDPGRPWGPSQQQQHAAQQQQPAAHHYAGSVYSSDSYGDNSAAAAAAAAASSGGGSASSSSGGSGQGSYGLVGASAKQLLATAAHSLDTFEPRGGGGDSWASGGSVEDEGVLLESLEEGGAHGHAATAHIVKANYEVLRLDEAGAVRRLRIKRRDLLREHALQPRDLRRIDPSLDFTKTSPSITIKEDVLLLNLGGIRAIVTADKALLFEPASNNTRKLLDTLVPRLQASAGQRLLARQQQAAAAAAAAAGDGGQSELYRREAFPQSWPRQAGNRAPPFELEVLEGVLMVATGRLDAEVLSVTRRVGELLQKLPRDINPVNLEELRRIKQALVELENKADTLREMLEQIMDDEDELAELNLSSRPRREERRKQRERERMERQLSRAREEMAEQARRNSMDEEERRSSSSSATTSGGTSSSNGTSSSSGGGGPGAVIAVDPAAWPPSPPGAAGWGPVIGRGDMLITYVPPPGGPPGPMLYNGQVQQVRPPGSSTAGGTAGGSSSSSRPGSSSGGGGRLGGPPAPSAAEASAAARRQRLAQLYAKHGMRRGPGGVILPPPGGRERQQQLEEVQQQRERRRSDRDRDGGGSSAISGSSSSIGGREGGGGGGREGDPEEEFQDAQDALEELAEQEEEEEELEEVEDLLEYYLQRASATQSEAERLLEGARDLEESIGVSLSARRYEVNRLELMLSMGSFAAALGAMIAGIFGMNMKSTLEMSVAGFWGVTGAIVVGCCYIFLLIMRYTQKKRIL